MTDQLPKAKVLGSAPVWPPPPRAPLPPFPSPTETQPGDPQAGCWTHDAFATALPFTPPSTPTLAFHRGNFCGHRVPGAPYVPGGCQDGSLIFTWFLYEYSEEWQNKILDSYQAAGYTHIDFHRAAWMGYLEGVPGCERLVALDLVRKCVARGLYVIVNLAIDNGPPDETDWKSWVDGLISAGMQIGCLSWQADQRMSPLELCDYIEWAAPYLHDRGAIVSIHWINEACAWWDPADSPFEPNTCMRYQVCDRFSFQVWATGKIDFHYSQYNVDAAVLDTQPGEGGLIGAIQDVLESLTTQQLVVSEYEAQAMFDNPRERLEEYCDLKGRSMLTVKYDGRTLSGYLNGARQPDGSAL